MWRFAEEEANPCVKTEILPHSCAKSEEAAQQHGSRRLETRKQKQQRRERQEFCCMAPQSCVMNPAQGSPPSVTSAETPSEDVAAGGMGTDELDLSSVRRCKSKSSDLPFSVESLISDRTPDRSLHSAECGPGCVRAEDTECASPRGLHRSKLEAVGLSDKEMSHWSQAPYASPSSEFRILSFFLNSLKHAL